MNTTKAAVCHAFGEPLRVEEIAIREPLEREVEVTLGAVAICHSDISLAEGAWGGSLPAVYGHEAAGTITALGKGVEGFSIGDRVVVTLIWSCGSCSQCMAGEPTVCEVPYDGDKGPIAATDGGPMHHGLACGAFAEKVVVDQRQIVAIPKEVPADVASLIACGMITGVGAVVNAAKLRPGEDVVVIGAGGVGLNTIQGAHISGARRIVAVDMLEEKLEDAKLFGATDGVLASLDAPWRAVRKALGGKGAEAVFVAVGVASAFDQAPKYLAPGGRMVMVGMPHAGQPSTYEPFNMAYLRQNMVGSRMGDVVIQRDIPWMVDLYQQGRLKLDELITKRWSLEEINEAFADTKAGKARRNVIVFDS